jgi:serine/threonine protein kinase
MTTKHAEEEYTHIQKIRNTVQVIPNYSNYFLLDDVTICKPSKLSAEDLKGYTSKCSALTKKDITAKNINSSLDEVLSLNMPYGGIDTEVFIDEHFVPANIIELNNSLIELLVNGIIPMNELHVFHCDIKDGNILVQPTETGLITRLIDWGISIIRTQPNGIPRKIYRRPFQYNLPFSSVLFNKEFTKRYYDFLMLNPNPTYYEIREFVINYIFIWNDIRGSGHLKLINKIMKKMVVKELVAVNKSEIKDHIVEYDFTYYYIIEYLAQILKKYTLNGKLNIMEYFNTIYLKNIDVWGFVSVYITLYEKEYSRFDDLTEFQMMFLTKLKYIIIHFLYETPTQAINVKELVEELTKLNDILSKFDYKTPSRKLEYLHDSEIWSVAELGGKSNRNNNTKTKKNRRKK